MTSRISLITAVIVATLSVGCNSHKPSSAISKVQSFHLRQMQGGQTPEPMIRSETTSRMWGAVTAAERRDRLGNYYTVHWSGTKGTAATVRFDYRQAKTGSKLFSQEVVVDNPGRRNVTDFQVTGAGYAAQGRVVSWRIQVIQDGQVIGEETSFLWD